MKIGIRDVLKTTEVGISSGGRVDDILEEANSVKTAMENRGISSITREQINFMSEFKDSLMPKINDMIRFMCFVFRFVLLCLSFILLCVVLSVNA